MNVDFRYTESRIKMLLRFSSRFQKYLEIICFIDELLTLKFSLMIKSHLGPSPPPPPPSSPPSHQPLLYSIMTDLHLKNKAIFQPAQSQFAFLIKKKSGLIK